MTKHLRMCKYARSKAADIAGEKKYIFLYEASVDWKSELERQ